MGSATVMSGRRIAATLVVISLAASPVQARIRFRIRSHSRSGSVSTRHRLTVNTLITEPGTFEWEWYGVVPGSGGFTVPTVWKITPGTGSGFWAHTELSTSFDALAGTSGENRNILQASDHVSFAATTALPSAGPLQLAFAPAVTVLLRGDSGVRIGATLLGKLENTRQQAGFSLGWSGADRASDTNPAGTFDGGIGYGFRFGSSGTPSKFTGHANVVGERSTGVATVFTLSEGMEYQATARFSADLTVQQLNLRSGYAERQVTAGITWNLGPVWGGFLSRRRFATGAPAPH